MIFVDTGAFYAIYVRNDENHGRAVAWMRGNSQPLATTNLVLAESLTLLRSRRHSPQATALSRQARAARFARIEWVTESDFQRAWNMFDEFSDKEWSFVDCTTRVVMERLGITHAFSFDGHFRQFGTVSVVP